MSETSEKLKNVQDKIDKLKPKYESYNKKLMLNKKDALDKAEIGHELYRLNIIAIGLLNELHREENNKKRLSDYG